jgi:hypothetical protein
METTSHNNPTQTRKAAVGGLAVVGFIALILIGIATAIYAASYLPKAIGRLSSANVYLSSLVQPSGNDDNTQLEAVNPNVPVTYQPAPTSTTTLPINVPAAPTTPAANPTPTTGGPSYTPAPTPTVRVVQVPASQNYYGLADLVTTITSVGYLRSNGNTSSFVAANTVPNGYQGAVKFVVANRGTNISNDWSFEARLPGAGSQSTYHSPVQRSLKPGDSIIFTIGFDSSTRGSATVRIDADSTNRVSETNESNNTASQTIYINGNSNNDNDNEEYDSNGNFCRYGTYYSNGRYYCETSSNSNNNSNYDSNGNYCRYGTYYQNGRYYCE